MCGFLYVIREMAGTICANLDLKTSLDKAGSDGMNLSPDYSAAFCVLVTDDPNFTGHGMVRKALLHLY